LEIWNGSKIVGEVANRVVAFMVIWSEYD
jgi:hypothetical protein